MNYTHNKQSYTLMQLVQQQRKMNKKPRVWGELDDEESAIGMHNAFLSQCNSHDFLLSVIMNYIVNTSDLF
jgi:hypothetical protein